MVGLIGKPNTGKSSFFNAATLLDAPVANYPFTTIEPNVGVAYITKKCVCRELGVQDNPRNSACVDGVRRIPVKLVDVAGLIPGASKGLGLGNKFLDDLRRADALIHVVDASGGTDKEGKVVTPGTQDPLEDVSFVEEEYDLWLTGILVKDWAKMTRHIEPSKAKEAVAEKLTGLGVSTADMLEAVRKAQLEAKKMSDWTDEEVARFASELRKTNKPILIAGNKADMPTAAANLKRLQETGRIVVPTSAAAELLLRKAAEKGMIAYSPGDGTFVLKEGSAPSPEQTKALEFVKEKVLQPYGSTGIQKALNEAYYGLLNGIVVYPVEDENRFSDKNGNVLPDAFVLPKGSTAKDLAAKVHSDLAESFLYAVDAKKKTRLGAEHQLKDGDVIKIVAASRRA
ncbi:MAG TPA: redox-regulated ATPase YchF [Conexivisphaerales archaeon]|nr:redox-regulated ATPase YchF [Conexivisphaerales archaeon]